jgi:hypothetical protein
MSRGDWGPLLYDEGFDACEWVKAHRGRIRVRRAKQRPPVFVEIEGVQWWEARSVWSAKELAQKVRTGQVGSVLIESLGGVKEVSAVFEPSFTWVEEKKGEDIRHVGATIHTLHVQLLRPQGGGWWDLDVCLEDAHIFLDRLLE